MFHNQDRKRFSHGCDSSGDGDGGDCDDDDGDDGGDGGGGGGCCGYV